MTCIVVREIIVRNFFFMAVNFRETDCIRKILWVGRRDGLTANLWDQAVHLVA